ncbi:hypothetical protein DFH08DRAFT_810520 [Mycena albidolilacea]|uniref:Uncharacterized protein n=1 Tax=Mycena albidolilacea TaxID=1033008 RepID=A0AAD7ERA8_9AGAR|nr:hypothetical protein DFH08DRAFT_810520 [Mycena albidolilacea]
MPPRTRRTKNTESAPLVPVSQDEESTRRSRHSAQPIAAAPPPPQTAPTGRASSSRPESQGFVALSGSQPVGRRTDSHRPETTTTGQPLFPVQNLQQTRRTAPPEILLHLRLRLVVLQAA